MMRKMETAAVLDHDGNERPAFVLERHEGIGVVIDWLRTGQQEIVHPERVRIVAEHEWDLGCEFDAFATPCFKCGQVKPDPRPYALCQACVKLEHEPQGAPMQLFAPAPNQIPGQLTF